MLCFFLYSFYMKDFCRNGIWIRNVMRKFGNLEKVKNVLILGEIW